jgi:hypothetical protein
MMQLQYDDGAGRCGVGLAERRGASVLMGTNGCERSSRTGVGQPDHDHPSEPHLGRSHDAEKRGRRRAQQG